MARQAISRETSYMPSRVVGFIKSFFSTETDVIEANKAYQLQYCLSADDVSQRVAEAEIAGDAATMLETLQTLEVEISDDYRWPWLCWPALGNHAPEYADIFLALEPTADGFEMGSFVSGDLSQEIYQESFQVRRGKLDTLARFFENPKQTIEAAKTLPLAMQVELVFYAMSEKCWQVIEAVAKRLLDGWQKENIQLHSRIAALLFDLYLRAMFRQAMPSFVNRPTDLTNRLGAIAASGDLLDKLGRSSSVVRCFEAARKSLDGDIEGAVALYDLVNQTAGFRTPVFNPSQTLLPLSVADDAKDAALSRWFGRYSSIDHHFRHKSDDEHVVLVASEQHYLDRYGELYVETLGMTNPGALVHFHFISLSTAKADILAMLDGWEATYGLRINCSFEENRIMRELTPYTSGISVTTRYIYMPDYMDAYASMTLTDIDGWLTAPIEKLSAFEGNDALISSWIWRKNTGRWRLPWANLAGGYISFNSTPGSRKFVKLLRKYLIIVMRNNVAKGRQLVYSDQAGVFLSLQHGSKTWDHKVGFLPPAGFKQSFEQREEFRSEGKQRAMKEKLAELKAAQTEMPRTGA